MCKYEEEKDMLAHVDEAMPKNPKNKRTNLLSSATEKTFETMNEVTKKNRGLSSLTYNDLYREE